MIAENSTQSRRTKMKSTKITLRESEQTNANAKHSNLLIRSLRPDDAKVENKFLMPFPTPTLRERRISITNADINQLDLTQSRAKCREREQKHFTIYISFSTIIPYLR